MAQLSPALLLLLAVPLGVPAALAVEAVAGEGVVVEGEDESTGLRYWEWRGGAVVFRLTQRLPDQTRAFFIARGFDSESADLFARSCVFQSLFKNAGEAGEVTFDLREWRVLWSGSASPLLLRDDWGGQWRARGLTPSARIAFDWSLLPTTQAYAPGDYNWGMTSYGLEPGTRFGVEFTWRRDGRAHAGRIEGLQCPPDDTLPLTP